MNNIAKELDLTNTNYVILLKKANPHGLQNRKNYSTARDQAYLSLEAMKYIRFKNIVK
jgi:D-alanyl-D-alanine carboxypeptidase